MFAKNDYVFMPLDFKLQVNRSVKSRAKAKNGCSGTSNPKKRPKTGGESRAVEVQAKHENGNSETGFESPGFIVCEECGIRFPNGKQKAHVYYHNRKQIVECPICAKDVTKSNLARHLKKCIENRKND